MDDLISRQEAIDAVAELASSMSVCTSVDECHGMKRMQGMAVRALDDLPSAQPEERKESLCKKVRALCEESKIEFFFVGGGKSTWSVTNDKHIKKIVECHKAQLLQERTEERTESHACDLISRQAAIDALDVLCQEHRYKIPGKIETYSQYNEAWQDALDRAEGAIFNLPSAQPERKKGKWIFKEDFRIVDGYDWKCDQCGSWQRYTSNYCPKCGARMGGCDD